MAHKPHVYLFFFVQLMAVISSAWTGRSETRLWIKMTLSSFFFMIICLLPGKNNKPRVMVLTLKKKKLVQSVWKSIFSHNIRKFKFSNLNFQIFKFKCYFSLFFAR